MKNVTLILLVSISFSISSFAQETKAKKLKLVKPKKEKLYDPTADAKADIAVAVEKANKEGKHVLIQFGGNWCGWCILFHDKVEANDTLRTAMNESYVTVLVNWSMENQNEEIFEKYGHPERFGFPVFIVLDAEGNRLHTQNSAYLEEGSGHSTRKVLEFFRHWSPAALDPKTYKR